MAYDMPSRPMRALLAWMGPTSVHFAAGRPLRGLAWIALLVTAIALIFRLPLVVVMAVWAAQVVDAVLLTPKRDRSITGYEIAMFIAAVSSVVFALALRFFWVEAFKIPSGAMVPTLQVGDHIFVDKAAKHPSRGEVIVFIHPKDPEKDLIKRVVAVAGDTVELRDDDQVVVNGTPVARTHVDEPCEYADYDEELHRWEPRHCDAWDETLDGHRYRVYYDAPRERYRFERTTVPDGSYYVLGDNRDNSSDSRVWGFVPRANIKGVARKIWWSTGEHGVRWGRLGTPIR